MRAGAARPPEGITPPVLIVTCTFERNIQGGTRSMQSHMRCRAGILEIDDGQASEVAEMLVADIIEWERS
jgi:hypothetical protein